VIQHVGVKGENLADQLAEVPQVLAAIHALDDETARRQAKVVVSEAVVTFRKLQRCLHLVITNLAKLQVELDACSRMPETETMCGTVTVRR